MSHVKMVRSGDIVEIYNYENSIIKSVGQRKKRDLSRRTVVHVPRFDNLRRRKKSFERLVGANLVGDSKPALLTITMSQNTSLKVAYKSFRTFAIRLQSLAPEVLRYIAVPEFQQRGAVHFHVIVWGLPPHLILHEASWSYWLNTRSHLRSRFISFCQSHSYDHTSARGDRTLQHMWQRGFLDCLPTDGSPALARYLSKYMSKSMQDSRLFQSRAYTSSHNILRSMSVSSSFSVSHATEQLGLDLSTAIPLQDHHFNTQWLGKGRYRIYSLNKNYNVSKS